MLYGFVTRGIPFFRTPKMRSSHGLLVALAEAREEVFVMLLLGAAAGIVAVQGVPSRDLLIWVAMLLVQSLPTWRRWSWPCSSLPKPREELAAPSRSAVEVGRGVGTAGPARLNGVPSPTFML